MKKIIALLLSFVYLVTSNGTTINFNYCMGRFIGANVTVSQQGQNKCSNCGMTKKDRKGCCNDEHKTIKLNGEQVLVADNVTPQNQICYLNVQYPLENFYTAAKKSGFFTRHRPQHSPYLFLLNCVFRL